MFVDSCINAAGKETETNMYHARLKFRGQFDYGKLSKVQYLVFFFRDEPFSLEKKRKKLDKI